MILPFMLFDYWEGGGASGDIPGWRGYKDTCHPYKYER